MPNDNLASPENRGKRLREIRETLLSGITRIEFSQASNISSTSLKGWELGWGGGLTNKGCSKLIDYFTSQNVSCTQAWLMFGVGEAPSLANSNALAESAIQNELATFKQQQNAINAYISDDSMLPYLYPKTHVAGITQPDIHQAIGCECIIFDKDYNTHIRVLEYSAKSGAFNLSPLNKSYPRLTDIEVITAAPIIWTRRE
ncbi:hypothetical protein [Piscirickettsia litoralis]|uniref:HTH cro/C1-type domain-containing protein n=1 Tax=Piscirickettsia litoralis TaxID=1891921 RepID=A0ABX3A5E7_9GAMM|nr:hypothetical protein [Piscirickettsia litoralis]ODN42863.1 hypothetical protein BGC07_07925 [Piscirickettsia litoralis]